MYEMQARTDTLLKYLYQSSPILGTLKITNDTMHSFLQKYPSNLLLIQLPEFKPELQPP